MLHCDVKKTQVDTSSTFIRCKVLKKIFKIMGIIELKGRKLSRRKKDTQSYRGGKGEHQRSQEELKGGALLCPS